MPRISLPKLAHEWAAEALRAGDTAIDATVGNGHDTAFLVGRVWPSGQVYGFDIQAAAIEATRKKLATPDCVTLIQASHADMAKHIPAHLHGTVRACMFNLGYLPGGDKSIITQSETTLAALAVAGQLLAANGIMTVLAYPGHPCGDQETRQIANWSAQLDSKQFGKRTIYSDADNPTAPILFVVYRLD